MHKMLFTAALVATTVGCIEPQQAILASDAVADTTRDDALVPADGVAPDSDADGLSPPADSDTPHEVIEPDVIVPPDTHVGVRYTLSPRDTSQTFFPGQHLRQPFSAQVLQVTDGGEPTAVGAGLSVTFQRFDVVSTKWSTVSDAIETDAEGWAHSNFWAALESEIPVRFRFVVTETQDRATPDAVEFLAVPTAIRFLATGASHSCAATRDELFCWGYNGPPSEPLVAGAGPRPMTADTYVPSEPLHKGFARVDYPRLIPLPNPENRLVYQLPESAQFLGIAVAGTAIDGAPVGAATCVSIGAPDENGLAGVWCVGSNLDNRLGNGSQAPHLSTWSRVEHVSADGGRSFIKPVIGLAGSANHFCAYSRASNERRVYCWGDNSFGQLGQRPDVEPRVALPVSLGPTIDNDLSLIPDKLALGARNSCIRLAEEFDPGDTADPKVVTVCWGANDAGQLINTRPEASSTPVAFQTETLCGADYLSGLTIATHRARDVAVGRQHICSIAVIARAEGVTEQAAKDQCGLPTLEPRVACAGANARGQRGVSENQPGTFAWAFSAEPPRIVPAEVYVGLAAGDDFTCGWTTAADAYCWGDSQAGQTGALAPRTVGTSTRVVLDPLASLSVSRVVAGPRHACALSHPTGGDPTRSTIYCWGDNSFGQSGANCQGSPSAPECDGRQARPIIVR